MDGQRRCSALLGEAVGVDVDIGEVGEGLEGDAAGLEAVPEFAEDLRGAGAVGAGQAVAEAGEGNLPARIDLAPCVGKAGAEGEGSPLRAAIDAEMVVVARGG